VWWLTPVTLASQKAEIRKIALWSQLRITSLWDPISKKPTTKEGWWSGSSSKSTCLASVRPWVQTQCRKKKWVGYLTHVFPAKLCTAHGVYCLRETGWPYWAPYWSGINSGTVWWGSQFSPSKKATWSPTTMLKSFLLPASNILYHYGHITFPTAGKMVTA
jgi:hypothetical protein